MSREILRALLGHWRRHPLQLATLVAGLALATALWSGVQAINAEARASYAAAQAATGQAELSVIEAEGRPLTVEDFAALRRAGWLVSPEIETRLVAGGRTVTLLGVEPLTAPSGGAVPGLGEGEALDFLTPPGIAYAAPETAERLRAAARAGWPEVRVSAALAEGRAVTDIGTAARLSGAGDTLTRLVVLPGQPATRPPPGEIAPGLVLRAPEGQGDLARLTRSFHLNLTAFGFLSFAVGLFIVHGAIGLAFEQRRATVRTLRALGAPLGLVMRLVAAELAALALVAGALGLALGYLVAAALLPDVAATLSGLYGAEVAGSLVFRPGWAAAGLAMALVGTALAAAQAMWRLWRLPLLASAQPRAWARAAAGGLRRQGAAAAALLAGGALAPVLFDGLLAGFAALGGLLLGAALALPLVLHAIFARAARAARRPLAQWVWADTRHQLPGLSLALMALLLALSANVGVGTMVASFRLGFTGWLDQRLAAELYVAARDRAEAAELRDWLAPRVDAVLPIQWADTRIAGQPAEVYGVVDHATYRDAWPLVAAGARPWDRVMAGEAALVNEQLARRAGLWPGAEATLAPGWTLPVAGVYSDYGNPEGQAIVGAEVFAERFPGVAPLRFGLRVPPGEAGALRAALVEEFGLPAEAIVDQASIKAFSLGVFDRTFAVTAALNVLTLAVAGVAMLTSLLTLSAMRLPQLAPVWAVGVTRRRLAALELARAGMLALLTFVLALPVGLALAWLLLAVVNVEAFGWRLPMHVFPGQWAPLAALAVLAAVLAALIPARRLARMPPRELVAVFTHDR